MYVFYDIHKKQLVKTGVSINGLKRYARSREWTQEEIDNLQFVGTDIFETNEPTISLKTLLRTTRADAKANGLNIGPDAEIAPAAEKELDRWKDRIGDYVKFVDEDALLEAQDAETRFPILYIGKLMDAYLIRIYQDEIVIAKIKPMWSDIPKHIQISLVRFAD